MVQNDIHRPHVLPLLAVMGKIKDTLWSCFVQPLSVIVQGCGRKLFFACSGNGNGSSWNNRGSNGNYWSASFNSAVNARNLNFNSGGVNPQNNNNRYNGFAVRPVQHTLLTILISLLLYGSDTAAAPSRPLSSILQCEEAQVKKELCKEMGVESQAEHGRAVRRFVLSEIQAHAIEMLHCGLPEEAGDICSRIQRPYRTSSLLQLHAWPVRENIYKGHIQLHQGTWHTLWNRTYHGLLQKGESQLAAEVLCHALGYSRLLHAYCAQEAFGDCRCQSEEDGHTSYQQRHIGYMGRYSRYGICGMADGNYRSAESERELHHMWRPVRLGWTGPSQEHVATGRRSWTSHWQSYEPTLLECVSESVRPIHETRIEVSLLWALCGRCSGCECKQRMAVESGAKDKAIPESGTWFGLTYGQAGGERGASWRRVPGCIHQTLANIYLESCLRAYQEEDCRVRLLEALEDSTLRKFLLRHIQAHKIVQSESKAADDTTNLAHWHLRRGYDQDYRQTYFL